MTEFHFDKLVFHSDDGRLRDPGSGVEEHLRPQASRLLQYLLEHAGEVVARERLYEAVWGGKAVVDFESGLAALMRELRQSIREVGGPADAIETVPRRGYRIDARFCEKAPSTRRWRPWLPVLGAAMLIVGGAAAWGVWSLLTEPQPVEPPPADDPGLAIIPFTVYDSTEELPEHVDFLLADTLLAELLARPFEGLDLLGRASLRPYLDRTDVVSAVAENLGVELMIEGTVMAEPGSPWRVELRLLEVPSGRVSWSTTISGREAASFSVRDIAAQLADRLADAWPELRTGLRARSSTQ
ncbi:MAG: hypothetical protein GVY32_02165 [Gammaproteobacteria bacterium]|nr:hypothetical protein [Gammaproteobacteria bacterium]